MTMAAADDYDNCNLALAHVTCMLGFESVVLRLNMHAGYFSCCVLERIVFNE